MGQQLRTFTLSEDLNSCFRSHVGGLKPSVILSPGDPVPLLASLSLCFQLENSLECSSGTTQPHRRQDKRNSGGVYEEPRSMDHEDLPFEFHCSPGLLPQCPPWSCHWYVAGTPPPFPPGSSSCKGQPQGHFSLCCLDGSGATLHSIQQPCCLNFNHKMLPWNWVYSYELAKDSCLQKVVM